MVKLTYSWIKQLLETGQTKFKNYFNAELLYAFNIPMCSIIPQVENIVYITFLNLLHKKTLSKVKKKFYYYVQEMLILHETEWEIMALVGYLLFL